jgi:hypothetical protein
MAASKWSLLNKRSLDLALGPSFGLYAGLACGAAFLIWLFAFAIISQSAIRAAEITDRDITLIGLSRSFVDGLEDERDREYEERVRQARERRRRERDDRYYEDR